MKFSISQSEFQNALSVVQKGVSARSTLPILSGILIEAVGDDVLFQATDLELSIQYKASALVEQPGKAVLPGKLLLDIVKNFPDAAVHVQTEGTDAIIICETSSFNIKGLEPLDFPAFPTVEPYQQISVPFDVFSDMAKKVCRVVSKDESRAILTGVLISTEGNQLKMVATDSYRLALAQADIDSQAEDFNAVIAGSFVSDLASLVKTGEDITLALADNQIIVSYRGTVFINRRLEGKYPNYKQLIPTTCETKCVIDRQSLIGAVRRASLLDHAGAQVRLSVSAQTQTMQLTAMTQDIGSIQETLKAQIEGVDLEIGFNSYYVLEGLNAMDSQEVSFEVQTSLKPGVFKGSEKENYLYLVMPVRI